MTRKIENIVLMWLKVHPYISGAKYYKKNIITCPQERKVNLVVVFRQPLNQIVTQLEIELYYDLVIK